MSKQPSETATNGDGRGPGGQFAKGNRFAKGNPNAKRAQRLRAELMRSVTPAELRRIVKAVVTAATDGDIAAAKLILDRTLGPAVPWDVEERLARLESLLEAET
ncbi:MAG: hypothetical protein GX575_33325 [Candidatus Anammoximicrobium sp.]|nr:hypothetical protein [Candidatus Anammoximicrobium sp.]